MRLPVNYYDIEDDLKFFLPNDLTIFELKAKALTFQEVLTYLGISTSDLPDIPPLDLEFAKKAHSRGQVAAIDTAAESLFKNMNTRTGVQAATTYLQHMSGQFSIDATPISNSKGGGFSFNINMNDSDT